MKYKKCLIKYILIITTPTILSSIKEKRASTGASKWIEGENSLNKRIYISVFWPNRDKIKIRFDPLLNEPSLLRKGTARVHREVLVNLTLIIT